jgi:hypothetical protein
MLKLEIMEGKERNNAKEYNELGFGTAVTLRLTKKYHNTNRTVIMDSAFASLKCVTNLKLNGLFTCGMVKTASRGYPKAFLVEKLAQLERGESYILIKNHQEANQAPIYAVAWKNTNNVTIITNRGENVLVDPYIESYTHIVEVDGVLQDQKETNEISRTDMIKLYYDNYSKIDIHNHYRQSSVAMERVWATKSWVHRLFGTILGIIFTDCFLAYLLEYNQNNEDNPTKSYKLMEYLDKLAYQLIHNRYLNNNRGLRNQDDEVY